MARKPGSPNVHAVHCFIAGYIAGHHRPPSIREISDGTGVKSTSHVHQILSKLAKAGAIEYSPRISRGIVLLEQPGCEAGQ
jgi:SOS-response transcriptional repressor LexA